MQRPETGNRILFTGTALSKVLANGRANGLRLKKTFVDEYSVHRAFSMKYSGSTRQMEPEAMNQKPGMIVLKQVRVNMPMETMQNESPEVISDPEKFKAFLRITFVTFSDGQ